MKTCVFPNCNTILRQENKTEEFCSLHQRMLAQNEIIYWRKKFYKELEYYKHRAYLKKKIKSKPKKKIRKGIPLSKYQVKQLKEITNISEDILARDRL